MFSFVSFVSFVLNTSREFDHRMRQPLTGPPWKKAAGVITPSRLKTRPSFITNCTCFNAFDIVERIAGDRDQVGGRTPA